MPKQYEEIPDELFVFKDNSELENESLQGSSLTFWQDAMHRFRKNKAAVISLIILIAILLLAIAAPFMGTYHNKVETYNGTADPNYMGQYQVIENKFLQPRIPIVEKLGIFDGNGG